MRYRLMGLAGAIAVCFGFTGCTATQNYSVRSFQGPLPMEDYRWVNPDSYGVPISPR